MEKPYDLKELGLRLKGKGLDQAEEIAELLYKEVKQWLKDSAAVSATPFDNLAMGYLDQLDSFVLPQIDKIDGNPN